MKLKKDLNLEQIVRWTGGFSVLFICTFLIDSAVDLKAQESEPKSFTPGSIPGQPFPQTEHSVRVASTEWSVPVTEAEAISWEPPQTLAQESPSDLIENTISDPPFPLTDELPIDVSEAAKSVVEQVSSSINDTTEATEAALDNSEASQLIEDVPAIPDTPAFELPDPVTEPVEDLEENFGLSVIAEGSSEPEGVATTESSCEPCSSPAAGIGTGRSYLNAPVPQLFTPVRNILGGFSSRLAGNESVHAVGQLTLLSLGRDYRGKGRLLTNGGPNLLAIGPDEGDFTGVDISYGRRRAGGKGWEMRYIGFAPESATDVSSGAPFLVWGGLTPPLNDPATWGGTVPNGLPETFGLSGLGIGGLNMGDIFNDAQNHRVTRDSEFGSFEMNLLRATTGGTRLSCGNSTVELFGGLRGLAFNETTTFTAGGTQAATFIGSQKLTFRFAGRRPPRKTVAKRMGLHIWDTRRHLQQPCRKPAASSLSV
jgi:hypothetical protein